MADKVVCSSLHLVDEHGREVASLSHNGGATHFIMGHKAQEPSIIMVTGHGACSINCRSGAGAAQFVASVESDGHAVVTVQGGDNMSWVSVSSDPNGGYHIYRDGKLLLEIGDEGGRGIVRCWRADGTVHAEM